ncbi:hypothetical protein N0V90_012506 [Kalmusia sp. IMI 367209]|nr:hypothetical protein N0V90_012506 [Kalmusia sp. IMI 367209]
MAVPDVRQNLGKALPDSASSITLRTSLDGGLVTDEKSRLAEASRIDLSDSIGTVLSGIQISALGGEELDELASLLTDRGVIIFEDQDFGSEAQDRIIKHFDSSYSSVSTQYTKQVPQDSAPSTQSHDEWHTDASYEYQPPSFSLLSFGESSKNLGETAWVSQYGLYDALSKPLQQFLDSLTAVHTHGSLSAKHPAIQTHPVTGLRALNVTPESVTRFPELKKKESDKFLELLDYHIQSSAEHVVRRKWKSGDVAIWDSRCTAYRHVSGASIIDHLGVKSSFSREKPYFDSTSESREARALRLDKEAKDERDRIEEIKARYNNTPLRRIIARQQSRNVAVLQPIKAPELHKEVHSPVDSVISESDDTPRSPILVNRKQRTEKWANEIDREEELLVKVHLPVKKSNTPLRRILERQLSASLDRRLLWS